MPPLYTAFHFLISLAGMKNYFSPASGLTCKKNRTIIYLARQPEPLSFYLSFYLSFCPSFSTQIKPSAQEFSQTVPPKALPTPVKKQMSLYNSLCMEEQAFPKETMQHKS